MQYIISTLSTIWNTKILMMHYIINMNKFIIKKKNKINLLNWKPFSSKKKKQIKTADPIKEFIEQN